MGVYTKIAIGAFAVVVAIFIFLSGMMFERALNGELKPGSFGRLAEAQP